MNYFEQHKSNNHAFCVRNKSTDNCGRKWVGKKNTQVKVQKPEKSILLQEQRICTLCVYVWTARLVSLLHQSVVCFKKWSYAPRGLRWRWRMERTVRACVPSVRAERSPLLRLWPPGAKGSSRNESPCSQPFLTLLREAARRLLGGSFAKQRLYYSAWFALACLRPALKVSR